MYKTAQGKTIDMDKLMRQNELVPAVGNARVNARGDKLGPGGKIVKKREDVVAEYYDKNPKAQINPSSYQVKTKTKTEESKVEATLTPPPVVQKPASSAPAEVVVTKKPSIEE
jgi:hypothetical protein